MREYVFTKQPQDEALRARKVHNALAEAVSKVQGVTVATHTEPWAVFVQCGDELSSEEHALVEQIIDQI